MIKFEVNGKTVTLDGPDDPPLLWVIRDELKLKGTKFGCGIAQCGACTIHLDGVAIRSCVTPLSAAAGTSITTIEGLDSSEGAALKAAWVEAQVPQCGYCHAGQSRTAENLLKAKPNPPDEEITAFRAGNLCRGMWYTRIKKAIRAASGGES